MPKGLHKISTQKLIFFCCYAVFAILLYADNIVVFRSIDIRETFHFLCMLAFALVLLNIKNNKLFLFISVLIGVFPYLIFCIVDRIFFGAFNDGAGAFGFFSISAVLFALIGLCIEFISFVIKLIQRKVVRPSKASLLFSLKNLLLLVLLAVAAFFASKIVGWGITKIFWNRIDYEFWNNVDVVEYGAGYSFASVMQDFRLLSLFPLFFIAVLCVKEKILARFSVRLRYFTLLLLGIFMFASGMVFGWEMPCAWNPLEDTVHTASFNPKNIPLLKVGQTKNEVIALIGEPLNGKYADLEETNTFKYTSDAASFWADFGWYELSVKFGADGRLEEITSRWMND